MRAVFIGALWVMVSGVSYADDYIVRFAETADKETARHTLENNGFQVEKAIPQLNMYVAQQVAKSADPSQLAKAAGVLYVEPNYHRYASVTPNDKNFKMQTGLKAMGAEKAWEISRGSKNVVVAVIDTGVFLNHVDLKNQIWSNLGEIAGNRIDDDGNGFIDDVHGWDFIKDADPNDDQGHGSHCSGIIGAQGNNGIGVAGVNWEVQIMPIKFLDSKGSGDDADGIQGIIYAADNGANIISASWGSPNYSQSLGDAIKYAGDHGVLVVVAAGNDGHNNDVASSYPANYDLPNLLSIGAASSQKNKADFSNYGASRVHLSAPGVEVFSTINSTSGYKSMSGTSMATPQVAGEAALILAAHPGLSMTDLRNLILNSVEGAKAWSGKNATNGFARVDHALESLSAGPQVWPRFLRLGIGTNAGGQLSGMHQMTAYEIASPVWSSSDTSVATVSKSGEVTALAPGVTDIFATDPSGAIYHSQIEVISVKASSGGCSAPAKNNDAQEAGMKWYMFLTLLPMLLFGAIRCGTLDESVNVQQCREKTRGNPRCDMPTGNRRY